ncbi:glutamate synthase subunit beta [Streptacidiphilus sp. EB129]|uniref:glutamate synthase subunit beta n=1 Tax=Streptacidiphilus sp. EB129 TaxID=3156262 RepID=UPI003514360F
MADPWGFLRSPRRNWPLRPVPERLRDWRDVHAPHGLLPIISEQAGRCMDCGIPFCHSSCPLGNLIPEWNMLVSLEDWAAASERLHATNNFPEFTGLTCPAPCENGCVLAINADPVAIKNVEAAIAEYAWAHDWVQPVPPDRLSGRTVAVIGSGPAGLACAQQLTRAGHTVAVYERDDRPGGLLRYGIPAFKLEKHHVDRRIAQMRAEGTIFRTGVAVGADVDAGRLLARYDAMVIAVGATTPRELPVPGRELAGIHQAMEFLPLANRVQEGDYAEPPLSARGRRVVIVGGGDTGADCLGTVLRQRAASVVQLDIRPQPGEQRSPEEPWPTYPRIHRVSPAHEESRAGDDRDVRVFAASTLRFEGDGEGRVQALHLADADGETRSALPGTERVIPAEMVLLALGFSGPERDSGLMEQLGLGLTRTGAFTRDPDFACDVPGVFVAGDAGRGQSVIVWAIAEGRSAAAAVDRYLSGATALPAPVRATDRMLAL